ncbi:hypothetical protein RSOL_403780 [Rhizoctonia solani AG-3 Rhs1AP]|uniref:MYND-type domain-containing protein n=1 Tax=Rhizoctonia solani AG-3 Rhs1AP TaxID=1086054 RepID=X8JD22_9AGAM|nr:hypothetical protein RSOL_403780 [Rhizoctonia solani AG-3 Rhs1AP]
MLLFWQVWGLVSLNSRDRIHDPLGVWLYDILRRCCLVCTTDQEMAVRSMMYDVRKLSGQWWNLGGERWKYGPLVDAEDSKAIIRAYLRRLKPTNSTGWNVPDMILVYHLIEFVAGFVVPEAEDLLPCLIGDSIDLFWQSLIDNQFGHEQTVLKLGRMFIYILKMINNILPQASDYTKEQLLDWIDKSHFIDLLGRTLLMCTPGVPGGAYGHEDDGHPDFMTCTNEICIHLQDSIPGHMFEPKFSHILDDWIKYYSFLEYRCEMGSSLEKHRENARHVQGIWKRVLHTLKQADHVAVAVGCVPPLCSYARCPFPCDPFGMRNKCAQCPAGYYSLDCQTRDWTCGSELGPHSRRCEIISRLESMGIRAKH